MTIEFVLSDFENVQFTEVGGLTPGACRIKVFLSQSQTKLSVDLVQSLQPFGADVEYIHITGTGPNALDFHIAYYIGRLAVEHPGSAFTIISGDSGFDPLIRHLAQAGIACQRIKTIPAAASPTPASVATPPKAAGAPASKPTQEKKASPASKLAAPAVPSSTKARVTESMKRLNGMKASRPKTVSALRSSIKSWFTPALSTTQLDSVMQSLIDKKKIEVSGTKVTYK